MVYKRLSDQELWQYCRQDDKKAYTELFERYFPKLYRLTSRNINDNMIAEELSMDLFFNLWQKRHQLMITGDVSAYLFRSIKNMTINHLQKRVPLSVSVELLQDHALLSADHADQSVLSAEVENVYQASLNELSPQRRKVFQLSREENMTYAEIAKETDLSVHTVKNYINAALAGLRKGMSNYTTTTLLLASLCLTAFL